MSDYREMLARAVGLHPPRPFRDDGDDVVEPLMDHKEFRSILMKFLDGEIGANGLAFRIEDLANSLREQFAECPEDPNEEETA